MSGTFSMSRVTVLQAANTWDDVADRCDVARKRLLDMPTGPGGSATARALETFRSTWAAELHSLTNQSASAVTALEAVLADGETTDATAAAELGNLMPAGRTS